MNLYITQRGTIIMTKIKNTKKGMAKKTLSMSLVVAMLATSNVPVWAAEFSTGTDATVETDLFSDNSETTPVVEDGNADVASTVSGDYDQLFFYVDGTRIGSTASSEINVPYQKLNALAIYAAKKGETGEEALNKETDYKIELEGEPNSKGNQIAKVTLLTCTFAGTDTYSFNVTDVKGTLDNTLATVTTESGAAWDGQWGTTVKANLDTSFGTALGYEWQKCPTDADQTVEANWTAVTDGNKQTYVTNEYLVKNNNNSAVVPKDQSLRVKVTYTDTTGATKTTYSTPIAVKPQKVNAEDITVTLGTGATMKDKLDSATVKVKGKTLKSGSYEYQGFDADYVGDQQIAFVLTSPYSGNKTLTVNANAVSIEKATVTANPVDYVYNPEGFTPKLTVSLAGVALTEGTDYTVTKVKPDVTEKVEQSDITGSPNGATVTINGINKYTGTATVKVNVLPANLADTCVIKAKKTTKPVGVTISNNNFSDYFEVYYKTSDGREIKLNAAKNFTVEDTGANNAAGLTNTVKVKGLAASDKNWSASQNFYGTLSVDFKTVAQNNIFDDDTLVEGSAVTKGAAFLGEIASAITGDVYMVNGQTKTKVARDTTPGPGETYTGSAITFSDLNSLKHYVDTEEGNRHDGVETLKINQDYTVTYNNNTQAGQYSKNPAPSITIKMIGKYEGERTFCFNIKKKDITDIGDSANQINNTTSAIVFNPLVTNDTAKAEYAPLDKLSLTYKGTKLVEGKDYEDVWVKWVNADKKDTSKGKFVYTLKARKSRNGNDGSYYESGNYTGTITDDSEKLTKRITAKSLTSSDIAFSDIDSQKWTGQAVKPQLKITDQNGKYTLVEGVDYTTEWKNNVNTGTATVTVTGIKGADLNGAGANRYYGKLQKTFTITSKSLSDGMIVKDYKKTTTNDLKAYTSADQVLLNQMYNDGKAVKAAFNVVDANNNLLVEGRDYTVEYKDNINVGTATITITGKGSYEGTLTATFKIVGQLINGSFDKKVIADQVYTGEEIKPEVNFTVDPIKLVEGKDYEIAYVNNVNCFTSTGKEDINASNYAGPYVVARGIGNYAGQIRLAFNIVKADLTSANVTVSDAEYAGGKVAVPTLTVKNPVSGKALVEGTDYTVTYKGGVNVGDKGEATILLKNTANYTINGSAANTLTVNYNVVAKDLKDVTVDAIADQVATGSQITPSVTVLNNDVVLTPDVDYTLSYGENKEVGVGTVTITAKGNNYKGTKEVTFNIVAAKPEIGKAMISEVRVSGNTVTPVLSGDVDGAVGYDYVIATAEDYENGRVDISKNVLKTNTNFYYVQEGTYYAYCHAWKRDENGKKVFGAWSNIKKFTVDATTPSKPSIKSVKVKGHTVTVTFTASENAKGYDVVLGEAVKKVNGENRPVEYGKLVVKNIEDGVYTATFYNVPDGKYYAGVHSYNKTSNDGKKVFSKWGYRKTAISVGKAK